jgi:flagella basal body P-ring formation protein FlgA
VTLMKALPKNLVGKVLKKELRKLQWIELGVIRGEAGPARLAQRQGVHITMNGKTFPWDAARENKEPGEIEAWTD